MAIIITPQNMLNLKARIINHELGEKEKVVYQLEVTNEQTGQSKTNKLRYSEFKNIHEELQKLVDRLKLHIILPQFPSRKLFGSTNKSEESIFERKKDLNTVPPSLGSTSTTCSPTTNSTASTSSRNTSCRWRACSPPRRSNQTKSTSRYASIGTPWSRTW